MLKLVLDKTDPERAFVPFELSDRVVLMLNNMGGMSVLEMYAIVDETIIQLGKTRHSYHPPFSPFSSRGGHLS